MMTSQKLLGYMLLAAIAVGGLLGVWYDVLRLSRLLLGWDVPTALHRAGKGRRAVALVGYVLRFAEDVIFGLSCTLALILLLYYTNDGRFRFLALLGMAAGYLAYRLTFGRLFDSLAPRLTRALRWTVKKAVWLLLWPLRGFCRLWQATVGAAVRRALARRREKRAIRYTERESCAYIQAAARGFDLPAGEEKNS